MSDPDRTALAEAEARLIFHTITGRAPEDGDAFTIRTVAGIVHPGGLAHPYGPPREARALMNMLYEKIRAIHLIYEQFFDEEECRNAEAFDCDCPCHTWSES